MQSLSVFEQHGSAAFESVTGTSGSATVEVGAVIYDGRRFEALGSIIDAERGIIVGYPHHSDKPGMPHLLRTWEGKSMGMLAITGHARGFYGAKLTCYSFEYEGVRYSGRGSGNGMLLRLRAGKRVA